MNTQLIEQAIALLRSESDQATDQAITCLLHYLKLRACKGTDYLWPRAFHSYLEALTAVHQSDYPAWRERLIAGPYHPWEYDEFERAIVEQTQARQVTLVYTRETVCICRPPVCLPSPESTDPAPSASAPSSPCTTANATGANGPASARSSSRITRSATATKSATGTDGDTAKQRLPPVQLRLL